MKAVNILAPDVGMARACAALRVHRAGVCRDDARRRLLCPLPVTRLPRPVPPLALNDAERQALKDVLCSERFADCAPPTIYATLLDEGAYLGSVRTMYRLCSPLTDKLASGAISASIPSTPNLSCWPPGPTRSGAPEFDS